MKVFNCGDKLCDKFSVATNFKVCIWSYDFGPVEVNHKCLFSGLGLETWEIKHPFWVRNRDFKTSILFPVFNSKLQVWFSFSQLLLRNLNLILVLLAYGSLYLPVSNCKVLRRAQTQTLKQTFTWVQTREKFWVSNPEFQTWKRLFLVYFNRPFATFRSLPILV